jgi:biotin carboxyl carrier protein
MTKKEELSTLNIDATLYKTRLCRKFSERVPYKPVDPGLIMSFIPGTVLDILVKPGQKVRKGDALMILDAMKMQNQLKCSADGKVKEIRVRKGDKVSKGTLLIIME